jgi:hypothetical protein
MPSTADQNTTPNSSVSSGLSLALDILLLLFQWAFLLSYFDHKLLFLKTITAGGDTGSHYYTALYLKEELLPRFKIMGWLKANYAGFPLFYHYFPLPFLIMAIFGYIIPLEISFKLVTLLGTFLLPISVYFLFRNLNYRFPVPIIASFCALAFLFNEKNSMWGGNIPSTLAGEFSFSLSFAIFVFVLGSLYKGIKENRFVVLNGILIALMGLSHGYTLFTLTAICPFFLVSRNIIKNFIYLFKVYLLGVLLMSFWFIPFLFNIPWATPWRHKWFFASLWEIFPPVLIPFYVLAGIGIGLNFKDKRSYFFLFCLVLTVVGYFFAYDLGLADIRFLSFAQFFVTISAATAFVPLNRWPKSSFALPVIVGVASLYWISHNTTYIKHWVKWNYSGFEGKQTWAQAQEIFSFLRSTGPGRVAYENSAAYDRYGTMRVFESLYMFAKRETLEGLYMQSSITAPFVFLIQAEISKSPSAPFPEYPITSINIPMAVKHLEMFGVTQLIAISNEVKNAIRNSQEIELQKEFGDIALYKIRNSRPHIVSPANYEPVLYTKKSWKKEFYEWFKNGTSLLVPLVKMHDDSDMTKFKYKTDDVQNLPKIALDRLNYVIKETVGNEFIEFETTLLNHPHIIKMSYHPNWKVEGAEKIYHIAPSFMMVYPTKEKVRLEFKKGFPNFLGEAVTFFTIILLILGPRYFRKNKWLNHKQKDA